MTDILGAMYDLVEAFTAIAPARILRAWPNRSATPPEEYAVITLISPTRRGTNASTFVFDPLSTDDGVQTESALQVTLIQFDFVGPASLDYAQKFELLSRSPVFCDFLAPFDITPLFCDSPREMTAGDGSEQYAIRYVVTMTINYWTRASAPVAWFDSATLNTEVIQ